MSDRSFLRCADCGTEFLPEDVELMRVHVQHEHERGLLRSERTPGPSIKPIEPAPRQSSRPVVEQVTPDLVEPRTPSEEVSVMATTNDSFCSILIVSPDVRIEPEDRRLIRSQGVAIVTSRYPDEHVIFLTHLPPAQQTPDAVAPVPVASRLLHLALDAIVEGGLDADERRRTAYRFVASWLADLNVGAR